jgi:Flp pilus assembly protein TadG
MRGRFLSGFAATIRGLAGDRSGAAAVFIAAGIFAMTGAVGLATDTARGYLVKARLNQALDAAALAGGRAMSSPARDADIVMYFNANFPPDYLGATASGPTIEVDADGKALTLTASAIVPTTLMRVLGFETIRVAGATEVTIESRNLEVSLVLDVTGSMAGQRIVDLREAARELVDIVVHDIQTPYYSKVALVPYSMGVNVGSYAEQVRGPYTNDTCTYPDEPTCRYYRFRNAGNNNWRTHEISTCVTERTGPNAYTDVSPAIDPVGKNYPNTPNSDPGTNSPNPCLSNTIVPLSSDRTVLHSHIEALVHVGSTAGHIGVAWGWYMISPHFGYLWPSASRPADYGTEDVLKVAVIMTDGEFNTAYHNGIIARDSGAGSGANTDKINQNATNGSSFNQALELCAGMKASGIVIYTVGFHIGNLAEAQQVVAQCATSPSHVYMPSDGGELRHAFRAIAMSVSRLRLSK